MMEFAIERWYRQSFLRAFSVPEPMFIQYSIKGVRIMIEKPWEEEPTIWKSYFEFKEWRGLTEEYAKKLHSNPPRLSRFKKDYEIFRAGFMAGGCS